MLLLSASSAESVERALSLAQGVFAGDCAAFYRIDEQLRPYDYVLRNVSTDFHREYIERMDQFDPLHVRTMVAQSTTVGRIDTEVLNGAHDPYGEFLASFGLRGAVEVLFSNGKRAHSGMCVMWRSAPPSGEEIQRLAKTLQDYLQYALSPRDAVSKRYGLTGREIEVAQLLCCGRTNPEIATLLGIGVATVKTHLINLYTKLGVETRTAAVGLLSSL